MKETKQKAEVGNEAKLPSFYFVSITTTFVKRTATKIDFTGGPTRARSSGADI
jgi:hypothetical protein